MYRSICLVYNVYSMLTVPGMYIICMHKKYDSMFYTTDGLMRTIPTTKNVTAPKVSLQIHLIRVSHATRCDVECLKANHIDS
jgi:hypothetical protein